jgi:hypothetical protein
MEHIKLLNSISNYILLLPNHESCEGKVKKVKIETELPFKKTIEKLATKLNNSSKGDQHNIIEHLLWTLNPTCRRMILEQLNLLFVSSEQDINMIIGNEMNETKLKYVQLVNNLKTEMGTAGEAGVGGLVDPKEASLVSHDFHSDYTTKSASCPTLVNVLMTASTSDNHAKVIESCHRFVSTPTNVNKTLAIDGHKKMSYDEAKAWLDHDTELKVPITKK